MDARLTCSRLFAIVLAGSLISPASAASLYKVVEPDGSVAFTDVPPPSGTGVVAETPTRETTGVAPPAGAPRYETSVADEAIARANARIDRAEHELAVARQGLRSPHDAMSLVNERMTSGERARVQYYKNGVQVARQGLMDLLRQRQALPIPAAR